MAMTRASVPTRSSPSRCRRARSLPIAGARSWTCARVTSPLRTVCAAWPRAIRGITAPMSAARRSAMAAITRAPRGPGCSGRWRSPTSGSTAIRSWPSRCSAPSRITSAAGASAACRRSSTPTRRTRRVDVPRRRGAWPRPCEPGARSRRRWRRAVASRVLVRRSTSLAPRVVVLGGGFAGVSAALELARAAGGALPIHVTLLSDRNFFLFTPMLAEAATGAVEPSHVCHPIRPLCRAHGIEFAEMRVESIDLERRRVVGRHHRSSVLQQVQYDHLVLALGATPNVAMAPGAAEHAVPFKAIGDAIRIRNRVIDLFEAAVLTEDPWARRRLLTFVVVGAGHAGTELIAAIEELTRGVLPRHYPSVPVETVRLVLVGSQVLPQTATNLAAYTKEQLLGRGIELETRRAAKVTPEGLIVQDGAL